MTHIPFIEKWPSLADFADDLCVAYGTAKAMKRRGVIPSQYWEAVVLSAQARGLIGVTYEALAKSVSRKSDSPASSSAGDDAGAPIKQPPAQPGAPATSSNSLGNLPPGEAGAQRSPAVCAPASVSGEGAR